MKKLVVFVLGIIFCTNTYSQDEFQWNIDVSLGLVPVKIKEFTNKGSDDKPVWKLEEWQSYMGNSLVHFGTHIPIYKNRSWSIGSELNIGIGIQQRLDNHEGNNDGLKLITFDFPQYLYYRNYSTSVDFAILFGGKYTFSVYSYWLPLAAVQFRLGDLGFLRFYGSLKSYKYYNYFTNGTLEPTWTIREYGIAYVMEM